MSKVKTKSIPKPEPKRMSPMEVQMDEALKLVKSYRDIAKAIFHDYKIDADAWLELSTAEDDLEEALMDMKDEAGEEDFDSILERLKDLEPETYQQEELLQLVTDESLIMERAKESSCLLLEVNSLADREKLQEFINNNIYPYCINSRSGVQL